MMKKAIAACAVGAFAVVAMGSSAFAGEVTGNGKVLTIHAKSECVYSGLDDQDPAEGGTGVVQPGITQNWGHTKDAPVVVAKPRGASDVTLDFGGGPFQSGCNARLHPLK
jgi:hypothetical protein